jgi:hypothetical protein
MVGRCPFRSGLQWHLNLWKWRYGRHWRMAGTPPHAVGPLFITCQLAANHPIAVAPNPRRPVLDTGLGSLSSACVPNHLSDKSSRSGFSASIRANDIRLDPLFPGNGTPGFIMALCANHPAFANARALLKTPGQKKPSPVSSTGRRCGGALARHPNANLPPRASGRRGPLCRSVLHRQSLSSCCGLQTVRGMKNRDFQR